MIFSELYSAYYQTVARILDEAVQGELSEARMKELVLRHAFAESSFTVLPALKNQKWQLLRKNLTTPLQNPPTMPLTNLQKQWLMAILADPRVALFDISLDLPKDTVPLFTPQDVCVYDRYGDGDPYHEEAYRAHFRTILEAIRTGTPLQIEAMNRRGQSQRMTVLPKKLEYSEKDDKFRLLSVGCRYGSTLNLSRILSCRVAPQAEVREIVAHAPQTCSVSLILFDARNTLERVMLHFAHFEKRAERLDAGRYRLTISYDAADETELVIRILSFGPFVKVEAPQSFVELIRDRLTRQKNILLG